MAIRELLHTLLSREVVRYDAEDPEHGPVHIVVEANRITGRRVRKVYGRFELDP